MREIFRFWLYDSFGYFWQSARQVIASLETSLAILETAKNLSQPLFQDFTAQGRIIGFFLRIIRIFFGIMLYIFIMISYLFVYLLFLVSPILFTYSMYAGIANQAVR